MKTTLELRKRSIISGLVHGIIFSSLLGVVLAYTIMGSLKMVITVPIVLILLWMCLKSYLEVSIGNTVCYGSKINLTSPSSIVFMYALMCMLLTSILMILPVSIKMGTFIPLVWEICIPLSAVLILISVWLIYKWAMPPQSEQSDIASIEYYIKNVIFSKKDQTLDDVVNNTSKEIAETLQV